MQSRPFESLTSGAILRSLDEEVAVGRRSTAKVLGLITEVEIRKLFAEAGYSSLWDYCTRRLHLSENEATLRIESSRAARRFPIISELIADCRLHMTGVRLLKPYLTRETANSLLRASIHKSRKEIEQLIADRFPRPDVPTQVVPAPAAKVLPVLGKVEIPSNFEVFKTEPSQVQAVGDEASPSAEAEKAPVLETTGPTAYRTRIEPLGAERFGLHTTINKCTNDLLVRAQELISGPPADSVPQILQEALLDYVAKQEKRKFAATDKPRVGKPSSNPRYIPARVKRAVRERDGDRCAFVGDGGHRCEARRDLEFDHILPVARGGESTVANVRMLCRTHNQLEAERTYGYALMEGKRQAAAAQTAQSAQSAQARSA